MNSSQYSYSFSIAAVPEIRIHNQSQWAKIMMSAGLRPFWRFQGWTLFSSFLSSGVCQHSLASGSASLQPLLSSHLFPWLSLPCFSQGPLWLHWTHPNNPGESSHLKILNLIISASHLFQAIWLIHRFMGLKSLGIPLCCWPSEGSEFDFAGLHVCPICKIYAPYPSILESFNPLQRWLKVQTLFSISPAPKFKSHHLKHLS